MYFDGTRDCDLYDRDYLHRIKAVSDIYGRAEIYGLFKKICQMVTQNARKHKGRPIRIQNSRKKSKR